MQKTYKQVEEEENINLAKKIRTKKKKKVQQSILASDNQS